MHIKTMQFLMGMIFLLVTPFLIAGEMTEGEMAGIIRSSDFSCAHVLEIQQTSEASWKVDCNSGEYHVDENPDGQFTVVATTSE